MKRLSRLDWQIAAGFFAVALMLRLVFLYSSPDRDWPHSILYEGDAPTWVAWAQAIDRDVAFEFDLPLRSPAVTYALHWFSSGQINGPFTGYKVLWCVFTSLATALAYLGFAMVFPRRVAMIGAALCAFSFGSHIISTSLNNEALYVLLLGLIVPITLVAIRRRSVWLSLGLGVLNGLALLVRPEHALLLMMLAGYMCIGMCTSSFAADDAVRTRPRWRIGLVLIVFMLTVSIGVCLPWMIRGVAAVHRYNTVSPTAIDYSRSPILWTADAREFLESLPAFARPGSFGAATYYNQTQGKTGIARANVESFFLNVYGYIPEPISGWTLVSMKGPLDFALANHPQSDGGFSKAALAGPGEPDPPLRIDRPDHLRLINRGYAVGWSFIRSDVGGWLALVRSKLTRFFEGVSLGFTSRNLPLGMNGQRRPIDLFTSTTPDSPFGQLAAIGWTVVIAAMILGGFISCCIQRRGGLWLVIIAYKLIVTIMFYGYARQAVSIHPAFFLLMAVSIDQLMSWCGTLWMPSRRFCMIGVSVVVLALMMIDVSGSLRRPFFNITGPFRPTPQWGPDAFESLQTIRFEPATHSSPP